MKILLCLLVIILVCSCDCWVFVDGKVIDSNSKQPIEKAFIEFVNIECTEVVRATAQNVVTNCVFDTDSTGQFLMRSDGYMICPDEPVIIKIRKVGYITKEIEINQGHMIGELLIELKKE